MSQTRAKRDRIGHRIITPLALQSHVTECGAACLGSVLAYFGLWIPLSELRTLCEVSRDGSSAAGIKRAAKSFGLDCKGRSAPSSSMLRGMSLPLILFWEFNHFVILEGFDAKHFYINDPACGRRRLTAGKFDQSYSGIVLEFQRSADFQSGGKRPSLLQRAQMWLAGTSRQIVACISCGLLLIALSLAIPLLTGIFVDHVLLGDKQWGLQIAAGLLAVALLVYPLTLFKQRWLKRLAARVSVVAADHHVSRLLRLPYEYFCHRFVGSLTVRILSVDNIARALSRHFLQFLMDLAMITVFLLAMAFLSPELTLVVLALTIVNFFLAYLVANIQLDKNMILRSEQGLMAGISALLFNKAEILRITASDDTFFARWGGHQARELDAWQSLAGCRHISASLSVLFLLLGHAAVLTFGAEQVESGELTLGQLAGFYILVLMFLSSAGHFFGFVNARHMLDADMQHLDDITGTQLARIRTSETDASLEQEAVSTLNGQLKLSGHVEFRNVTFGYNRSRKPLIENFNLTIEPGQRVALVGASGSGKSSAASVLAGFFEPWSGEIRYDGYPLAEIPGNLLSRSISLIDQHVTLFATTVRENITLWNPSIPEKTMIAAARDAAIHDVILSRPEGYETRVEEGGANFSGGQKQRLGIARALASEPTFAILDEATSALDAKAEELIDKALRRRGMSCLIIAHRLSTIRDCDRIVVLDKGGVVQQGIHDELISDRDGLYYQLVQAG